MEYETIQLLDTDENTGEELYSVRILTGDVVSVIVAADGTELFNDDWQGNQPQTFAELRTRYDYLRWYPGEQLRF